MSCARLTLIVVSLFAAAACGRSGAVDPVASAHEWDEAAPFENGGTPRPAPVILSVWPTRVSASSVVFVEGYGFDASAAGNEVTLNGNPALVLTATASRLTVRGVPAVSVETDMELVAAVDGQASPAYGLKAVPAGDVQAYDPHAPATPRFVVAGSNNRIYFTDEGGVFVIDEAGWVRRLVGAADGLSELEGIAWLPDGDLVVADRNNALMRVDPVDGAFETMATGLAGASAVATDADGYVYVLEAQAGRVRYLNPDGELIEFATTALAVEGSDLAVLGNHLYMTTAWSGTIERALLPTQFGYGGGFAAFVSGLEAPMGLTVDGGDLIATGYFADQGGAGIIRIDSAGTVSGEEIYDEDAPLWGLRDVARTSGGAWIVTDDSVVSALEIGGGEIKPIAQGLGEVYAMAAHNDRVYAAVASTCAEGWSVDSVVEIKRGGATRVAAALACPTSVAVDSSGAVLASDHSIDVDEDGFYEDARIVSIDASGAMAEMVSGTSSVSTNGMATDPFGNIYVVDTDNMMSKYNAGGGMMAQASIGGSTSLGSITESDGSLYIVDTGATAVYRYPANMEDGPATAESLGEELSSFGGVAASLDGRVYVAESDLQTLMKVDNTGELQIHAFLTDSYTTAAAVDVSGGIWAFDADEGRMLSVTP